MKTSTYSLLVLGGLPLLVYPFVFLASMMSIVGHRTGTEPLSLVIASKAFLYASIAYPAFYVPCFLAAKSASKKKEVKNETRFASAPMAYLALLVGLFFLWSSLEVN